jgi:hypothetical protein
VSLWTLLAASEARAEIYKCVGSDGKATFTSDPGACPGTKPHELKSKVQHVIEQPGTRARRAASPAVRRAGPRNDGHESMWRRKRPEAEAALQEVEGQLVKLGKAVKACNRGGEWYRTSESGIREHIPCEEFQTRLRDAEQKREQLVDYLAEGLEDECRRAGCQPGWVR